MGRRSQHHTSSLLRLNPLGERPAMFTPKQYRTKALECADLAKTALTVDEAREFKRREQSFTVLADNEHWLADHREQTVQPKNIEKN